MDVYVVAKARSNGAHSLATLAASSHGLELISKPVWLPELAESHFVDLAEWRLRR